MLTVQIYENRVGNRNDSLEKKNDTIKVTVQKDAPISQMIRPNSTIIMIAEVTC